MAITALVTDRRPGHPGLVYTVEYRDEKGNVTDTQEYPVVSVRKLLTMVDTYLSAVNNGDGIVIGETLEFPDALADVSPDIPTRRIPSIKELVDTVDWAGVDDTPDDRAWHAYNVLRGADSFPNFTIEDVADAIGVQLTIRDERPEPVAVNTIASPG